MERVKVKRRLFSSSPDSKNQGVNLEVEFNEEHEEEEPFQDSGSEFLPEPEDLVISETSDEDSADERNVQFEDATSNATKNDCNKQKPRGTRAGCKPHNCYFCSKLFTNLRKHWRAKHSQEVLFQEALKASHTQGKHHRAFEKLRKLGDANYNKMHENRIVVRKSNKRSVSEYITCVKCQGYFLRKNYHRHRRSHCLKTNEEGRNLTGAARVATCRISRKAHPLLVKDIFPFLIKDEHRQVLFNDPVAIIMGNILIDEQLSKPDPADLYKYVSGQLRLLADLFNVARKLDPNIKEIDHLFYPSRYNTIVESIRQRGNYQNGIYRNPFPAIQSCTILTKVALKLKSMALSEDKMDLYERYDKFAVLIKEQQNTSITKVAGASRVSHRRQKTEVLPTTADVRKLLEVLEQECSLKYHAAQNKFSINNYCALSKTVAAYIMVLNRRRPGDVHKTTLSEFANLTAVDEGFLSSIQDDHQKKIASSLYRYITKGKLNKTTANLLTKDMVAAVNFLIKHRVEVGIAENDIYVFSNPRAKRSPFYRADESLREICKNRGLDYNNLRATKLRKHFATTTSNMDQGTQKIISDFMGHSQNIHENIYQVRQIQTDISVVGQLLFDASGIYHNNKPLTTEITSQNSVIAKAPQIEKPSCTELVVTSDSSDDEIISKRKMRRMRLDTTRYETREIEVSVPNSEPQVSVPNSEPQVSVPTSESQVSLPTLQPAISIPISKTTVNQNVQDPQLCLQDLYIPLEKVSLPRPSFSNQKDKKYNCQLSNETYKEIHYATVGLSQTWRTPQKHSIRQLFKDYLDNNDIPDLIHIQETLRDNNMVVGKSALQIQAWIRSECTRRKRDKGTTASRRGWTTPQRVKLRKVFSKYYAMSEKLGKMVYPSQRELRNAVEQYPEFQMKSEAILRSKLQHEFRNWPLIQTFYQI